MAALQQGVVKLSQGRAALTVIPIPELRDDYILVKTIAVALNPTDWQTVDEASRPGTPRLLLGCDFAGVVVEVGKDVTKNFRTGDRICGAVHGGNDLEPEDGAFAEYIVVKGDVALHMPSNLSFEDASTLGCGVFTICLGLYHHLQFPTLEFPLPERTTEGPPLLIYGGSTATGTLAIQFAKLSGYTVITTASPHNFDLLKSLGADHVFDYHDPECGSIIRELTHNTLTKVFDTIATASSAQICADALSSSPGGLYVNLMGENDMPRKDVENIFFLGYTLMGEAFEIEGTLWLAVPEDYERGKKFSGIVDQLLEKGLLKPHPADVRVGFEGILDGMQEYKEGKVSGKKLVYRIGEVETNGEYV